MIDATLHGGPLGPDQLTTRKLHSFQQVVIVEAVITTGFGSMPDAVSKSLADANEGAPPSTEHRLEYRFTHHDGATYHYQFTAIDP